MYYKAKAQLLELAPKVRIKNTLAGQYLAPHKGRGIGLGDDKPQGSGVLCTMIVGGAVLPPSFGFLTDRFGFSVAFILVMVAYAYIFFYGFINRKRQVEI